MANGALAVNEAANECRLVSVNGVGPLLLSARRSLGMEKGRPIRGRRDDSFRVGWLNSGLNHSWLR